MVDGIYLMTFRGAADWGLGMLMLRGGLVTGADASGILYDGSYREENSSINCELAMTVPAGVQLVQGTPAKSEPYSFNAALSVPRRAFDFQETVLLELPQGPVNVIFQRLRTLDG